MIKEAIQALVSGHSLTVDEAVSAMEEIMRGGATPAQIAAFVTALRLKGETVDEIVGLARAMRSKATPVSTTEPVVDNCGTGGGTVSQVQHCGNALGLYRDFFVGSCKRLHIR